MSNNVELVYNPYRNESKITVNGNTVSLYGEISNYLKEPFSKWYMKILDIIGRELNDDFSLTFISGKIETEIMRMMAEKNESCVSFEAKPFLFEESIYSRAAKLSEELFMIGFSAESGPICNCNILCEQDEYCEQVRKGFEDSSFYKKIADDIYDIEGTQFYNVLCNVKKFGETIEHSENELNIYLTNTLDTQVSVRDNTTNIILCIASETNVVKIENNNYTFNIDKNKLFEYISEVIGYTFVCPCFVQAFTYFKQNQSISKDEVKLLDAIEPMISVKCDAKTLEVGQCCNLTVEAIPSKASKPDYDVKISNENTLRYVDGKINAISQGTALVEVCLKGTIQPIFSTNITVVQLNRIQAIEVQGRCLELGVGDVKSVEFTYSPRDATDVSEIRFSSNNENVAIVSPSGEIKTIAPGKCEITIATSCVTTTIEITVKPKLQNINLSYDVLTMLVGQERELDYAAWPLEVIDKNIEYKVEDESIVEYNGRVVRGKSFGNTKIIFRHPQTGVTAVCSVEVKSTLQEKNKLNIFKILSFILFVVSLVCISKEPINYGIAIGGIISGIIAMAYENKIVQGQHTMLGTPKKPEIAGCIVGIILNILAIVISIYV